MAGGGTARWRDRDAHPGKRAGRARRRRHERASPVRRGRRLLARAGHATSFRGGTDLYLLHGKRRRERQARLASLGSSFDFWALLFRFDYIHNLPG
jgi:hypothetical protein